MAAMRDLLVHHVDDLDDIMDKLHHGTGEILTLLLTMPDFSPPPPPPPALCSQYYGTILALKTDELDHLQV